MANWFAYSLSLARAGITLGWHGAEVWPQTIPAPLPLRVFRWLTAPFRRKSNGAARQQALSGALASLGPSYIKLGQFLATRPDVIGRGLASDLSGLQDNLPPFPMAQARASIESELGAPVDKLFAEFGPPIAAASIAQVHKASVADNGRHRAVAVKVLRPGVEARFRRDLDGFSFAARQLERFSPASRRLRPAAAVETLAASTAIEMDLRMEAAAISELGENIAKAGDIGFRVPKVDWTRTSRRVLTLEWIDGIPLSDMAAIGKAGFDREKLGNLVIRSFLCHAMRDGFFHADLHQGNLFAERDGSGLVAVDFGIMGRLGAKERRFLAEILYGFITRQYRRIAEVHFEAGYVPQSQDVATFAQALRAIGEPIKDRPADEISMARVLTQLFEVTEMFGMRTRPELLLLQKTMVVTEGVARSLDPRINIWTASEPVVKAWIEGELGAAARLKTFGEGAAMVAGLAANAPKLLAQTGRAIEALADVAREQTEIAGNSRARWSGWSLAALWTASLALAAIALKLWL
jgi:ubiquinone biosynthesis protein